MSQEKGLNQRLGKIRKKIGLNLIINWFVPVIFVILLRHFFASDTIALAIAGAIPAVRTIILLVWRRKVDWIGVLGTFGFAVAFAVSTLSGGSSLPLKLYHPVVTGIIGFVLLVSVAIRRPLLIVILQILKIGDTERFSNLENNKFTNLTFILGIIFILDALIHIVMALTLATVEYLSMSRVVTMVGILLIVAIRMLISRRNR